MIPIVEVPAPLAAYLLTEAFRNRRYRLSDGRSITDCTTQDMHIMLHVNNVYVHAPAHVGLTATDLCHVQTFLDAFFGAGLQTRT